MKPEIPMGAPHAGIDEAFDLLETGAASFDKNWRLQRANPAFLHLRRYPAEICRPGVSLRELLRFNAERGDFGPGDPDAHVADRLAEIGDSDSRVIEREMTDGRVLRISYRRTPAGGLLIAIDDRTEERRALAALAASEERHALVTRATSDGIYDWNVDRDLLYVSVTLRQMLGFDIESIGSRAWADRVHEADRAGYAAAIRRHFRGEADAVDCGYRIKGSAGDWRWIHDRAVGVRDNAGRVVRLVGAVRDVTEIRAARSEIERVRARLYASLSTISDGILLVDAEDRVELWNDRYAEIFGHAAGGADMSTVIVKGRDFFEMIAEGYGLGMFKPHPDGAEAWVAGRRAAWREPKADLEVELANGMWIHIAERRMPDGGRACIYADITLYKRREREAQAARRRFEEAIEAISSGFALWDADDRLVIGNTKYKEYFEDLADAIVPGAYFYDIVAAGIDRGLFPLARDDPEGYLDGIRETRAIADGATREQFIAGFWLQITDHRTDEGGTASIYTDITGLKTRQREIEAQSAILELTLENMGQGISLVDTDLKTTAFNKKFLQLMDFPPHEFPVGFTMEQAFRYNAERGEYGPGDVEEQVRVRLERARQFKTHRVERVKADGTVLEIVGNAIEGGGFVSTYTDITERKRADEALKAAVSELNAVLDAIDYGVLFIGPDLRARFINRAFAEIWNMPAAFIAERPTFRDLLEYNRHTGVYDVAPEDWESYAAARIESLRAGPIAPLDFVRADGKILRFQCVALPDGGRMLTYFDITEIKGKEAALVQAKDAAEAALADLELAQARLIHAEKMASLGQLTAGIAHEIKNPLNFVNNFARLSAEMVGELGDLLASPIAALGADDRDDAEDLLATVKGNLEKIDEHGKRADSIVRNMLMHSREGVGERRRVDVGAIALEAMNLAYHGARAADPGFNVELNNDIAVGAGPVDGQPQELQRVFLNLCSNGMYAAAKRNVADGRSPRLDLRSRIETGALILEVEDNGDGVPEEIRAKIFQPFFTTKPTGEGTGLGLSMSYDIVRQHGGEISVESEAGRGSVFRVKLPTIGAEAAP